MGHGGSMSEALRLAEELVGMTSSFKTPSYGRGVCNAVIEELRRLHAECEQLKCKIAGPGGYSECAIKAQEDIGRLNAENERLREALRNYVDGCSLSVDAAEVARAALK